MGKSIGSFKGKNILFHATHLVEFFPTPLPDDLDGESISSESDLFRTSHFNGWNEVFLTIGKAIDGECEGRKYSFAIEDFLRWQLERVNEETLWQLISKTDASVSDILDSEMELEKDADYNPEEWINFYNKDEYPGKGLAFIKRLREEAADDFYGSLIESMLGEYYGLFNTEWYETKIDGNLDEVRASYANWDVPLMIISTGKFRPYVSADNDSNLMMDDYDLKHMHVRNYDEGDPL